MKERVYSDFYCLVHEVTDSLKDSENATIIAKYDIAKDVLFSLMCNDFDPEYVSLEADDNDYLISVFGDDGTVYCEPLFSDDIEPNYIGKKVFIHADCKMSDLDYNYIENPDVTAFEMSWEYDDFDEEDLDDTDCDDCEGCALCEDTEDDEYEHISVIVDDDDIVVGFEYTDGIARYSYYSDNEDDVIDAIKEFIDFLGE